MDEARALYDLVKEQDREGALGIVQGEHALERLEFEQSGDAGRDPYGEGSFPQPYLPGSSDDDAEEGGA